MKKQVFPVCYYLIKHSHVPSIQGPNTAGRWKSKLKIQNDEDDTDMSDGFSLSFKY